MKLLRLKITDSQGFRGLPCGFEHHFRTEWSFQDELANPEGFAPFVCTGLNGSGKSNLLEAIAAIFFQLEVQRVRRSFLPPIFDYDPETNPEGVHEHEGSPNAYELEYLIQVPESYQQLVGERYAHVRVLKEPNASPWLVWVNSGAFVTDEFSTLTDEERAFLLPEFVLGYSSGENEILSLPFFKMRFVQFDEYWNALTRQLSYAGHPETRLAYLDSGFSQAILLCNLLFQDDATLQPFREDVGIEALRQFRIIVRRSIPLSPEQIEGFDRANDDERRQRANRIQSEHPNATGSERMELNHREIVKSNIALRLDDTDSIGTRYRLNLIRLLEADEALQGELKKSPELSSTKYENFDPAVTRLKRCATSSFIDEATDTLTLDYWVNDATKQAFRENFENSPLALFQAFQVLLTLNLYAVSDTLKTDLYRSTSHYASETVPTLASDERIMRFKDFYFSKQGVQKPMLLKELSDGEHQLLHSLGLCLLFRNTNSLFLLDEPETHFNPDWRASFITRLRQCLPAEVGAEQEMLITTHSPFLISDSHPEKVLVFTKDGDGVVSVCNPKYNTLGASINKITMETFGKRETIGERAEEVLAEFAAQKEQPGTNLQALAAEIQQTIGDSVERTLLIKEILDAAKTAQGAN